MEIVDYLRIARRRLWGSCAPRCEARAGGEAAVDGEHVALSYQFFNKTRRNLLANPRAVIAVIDPFTCAHYRLQVEYLRTEQAGPLFESMRAKLSGLASHTGMTDVFQLLGADVVRVRSVTQVPGPTLPAPAPRRNLLLRSSLAPTEGPRRHTRGACSDARRLASQRRRGGPSVARKPL